MNEGQVYVTLTRLEKSGLVSSARAAQSDRPDRKVYELTAAGRERLTTWLHDTSWPKPGARRVSSQAGRRSGGRPGGSGRDCRPPARGAAGRAREAQRAALAEPEGSVAVLLLEGVVLRLQADLRWLEECARFWNAAKGRGVR